MKIYVMSHNRPDLKFQMTLRHLTRDLLKDTVIVVQEDEEWDYLPISDHFEVPLLTLPPAIRTLSPSIEHVGKTTDEDKFFILDDDLKFAKRDGLGGLENINNSSKLESMFGNLERKLEEFAMVGISARFGNNHVSEDFKIAYRQMCLHGFRKEEFLQFDHNRVGCRQDFDRTLQYICSGFPNYVDYNYTHDQKGSNTEGGCSTYRDKEMLKNEAYRLQSLHPDFVNVIKKVTKSSWGGEERYEVRIQWRKAFKRFNQLDSHGLI